MPAAPNTSEVSVPTPTALVGKAFEWRPGEAGRLPTLQLPNGAVARTFPADLTGYAGIAYQMLAAMYPLSQEHPHQVQSFPCGVQTSPVIARALCHLAFAGLPNLLASASAARPASVRVEEVSQWLQQHAGRLRGGLLEDYPPRYTTFMAFKASHTPWLANGNAATFPIWPRATALTVDMERDRVLFTTSVGTSRGSGPIEGDRWHRLHPLNMKDAPLNILNGLIPPNLDGLPAVVTPVGLASMTAFKLADRFREEVYARLPEIIDREHPEWMCAMPDQYLYDVPGSAGPVLVKSDRTTNGHAAVPAQFVTTWIDLNAPQVVAEDTREKRAQLQVSALQPQRRAAPTQAPRDLLAMG